MTSSISEKRNQLSIEAEQFLIKNGFPCGLTFYSFAWGEQRNYQKDVQKFKLLFNNGHEIALWNALVEDISIDNINKDDFSAQEWSFIRHVSIVHQTVNQTNNINSEIKTKRLRLLPSSSICEQCLTDFWRKNNEEFFEYTNEEYIEDGEKALLHYKNEQMFYLVDKQSEKTIGYIALKCQSYFAKVYNIEYFILPNFRQKGYATEALSKLIKAAFNGWLVCEKETIRLGIYEQEKAQFALIRLKARHTNQASIHLAQKLGFSYDGMIKKGICCPTRQLCFDEMIYSLENQNV